MRLVIISALLLLTACGFAPVYGKQGALPPVSVQVPGDSRESFTLRRALEDAFANPQDSHESYALTATPVIRRQPALTDPDGRVARYMVNIDVSYRLMRTGDAAPLQDGTVTAMTGYTLPASDYAAFQAERDAVEDGMRQAAANLRLRVLAVLAAR